jgi:hypothetical protein
MTRFALLWIAAALPMMFASPLPAQAITRDQAACPIAAEASPGAGAPAPSARWMPPGCETKTMPWSAPVGHRQPQAADIPSSASYEQALEEENAKIDRIVRGVCRGC